MNTTASITSFTALFFTLHTVVASSGQAPDRLQYNAARVLDPSLRGVREKDAAPPNDINLVNLGINNEAKAKEQDSAREVQRGMQVFVEWDTCWGAIAYHPGTDISCVADNEPEEEDALRLILDQGCCNETVETFFDTCAAMVWSDAEEDGHDTYGFSSTGSKDSVIEAARDACAAKAVNASNCVNEEWECSRCYRSSPGRPFIDSSDRTIVADATIQQAASWAAPVPKFSPTSTDNNTIQGNVVLDKVIGSDWAERGVGEHASIASFAAFTLNLMTNGAPPELIRDALLAALDEVDHALSSFEVASIFAGKIVEPGLLPPSSHYFKQDVTSLALSTAKEGCIDETLSALAAANEVDALIDASIDSNGVKLLQERLKIIAVDEGKHSALAWRTILWACSIDSTACATVNELVLNPKTLSDASNTRDPSGKLDKSFETIYTTLIPLLSLASDRKQYDEAKQSHCSSLSSERQLETPTSMVAVVTWEIIDRVLCGEL